MRIASALLGRPYAFRPRRVLAILVHEKSTAHSLGCRLIRGGLCRLLSLLVARTRRLDLAESRIFHGTPIPVIQSMLLTSTLLRPWDREWLRRNRDTWTAIRKFTTLSNADLAERIGISTSSLTRYSKGDRTPTINDFELICVAMSPAMNERANRLEEWLCFEDYRMHLAESGADVEAEDFSIDIETATRWIAGPKDDPAGNWEPDTIDHLPSLAQVSSLQPVPAYRPEDDILFGYLGFAVPDESDPIVKDADEAA